MDEHSLASDRPRRRPALRRQPFPPARAPQSRPLSAKSSTWNAAGELEPIRSSKGEIGHSRSVPECPIDGVGRETAVVSDDDHEFLAHLTSASHRAC